MRVISSLTLLDLQRVKMNHLQQPRLRIVVQTEDPCDFTGPGETWIQTDTRWVLTRILILHISVGKPPFSLPVFFNCQRGHQSVHEAGSH